MERRKKAHLGFWKEGKQLGFGKLMKKKNISFGIWKGDNKVNWFKNEKEGLDYLENNGLGKYKNIFELNLEKLYNFGYNNNDIENLSIEQDKTHNDDISD